MELVDAVTVVDYLEPTHHVARDASFLFVADLLPYWVVLAYWISLLVVVISLSLESSFDGLDVVFAIRKGPVVVECYLFGVDLIADSQLFAAVALLFKEFVEVGDEFF